MKLLAFALAAAAVGAAAASASSKATVPGLVYTAGYGNSIVDRVDPVTLRRTGPHIRLGGNASSWSYSPRGRYVAIASYPQRLTVIEVGVMRVVARLRLTPGGGVVRAVTWTDRDRVVAVVETPSGSVVVAVDPRRGEIVRRTRFPRPWAFEFARVPGGLVFLLGARGRIAPAQIAVVDSDGRAWVKTVPDAPIGFERSDSGEVEQRSPGLAVDSNAHLAYVVSGERVFVLDLETRALSRRGPFRVLAKAVAGETRSARWLGGGLLAVSGVDASAEGGRTPAGLRLFDVRDGTIRTIDRATSSFTLVDDLMLVESAVARGSLLVTAYARDGQLRYHPDLAGATWLKKQGRYGYACRDDRLRAMVDLSTGALLRSVPARAARCPTILAGDSRA